MRVKRRFTKRPPKKNHIEINDTLCRLCDVNSSEPYLGQLLSQSNFHVHENCLFFSPVLNQELDPSTKKRGYILGFKIQDIEKEIKRISRLKCCICKDKKAGIGCCMGSCKKSFHLSCGLKNSAIGIFIDTFQFYCSEHATHQVLCDQLQFCKKTVPECTVCLELALAEDHDAGELNNNDSYAHWTQFLQQVDQREVIHGMCCPRSWMHRSCVSRYGLSAGLHHVKCPNCGNTTSFVDTIQRCGIWLPDRDASWELEPGAFQDMYDEPDEVSDNVADVTLHHTPPPTPTMPPLETVATQSQPSPPPPPPPPSPQQQLPPDINNENLNPNSNSNSLDMTQGDIRKYLSAPNGSPCVASSSIRLPQKTATGVTVTRKRSCQSDLPMVPAKRRRKSKDKVVKSSPLLHRQCSRCSKDLVCFGWVAKRGSSDSSTAVAEEDYSSNSRRCVDNDGYICVSCYD